MKCIKRIFNRIKTRKLTNKLKWQPIAVDILVLINIYRVANGLNALKPIDQVLIEAENRSEIQGEQGFMSHDGMGVTTQNLEPFGITYTGENLGRKYITADRIVKDWMESHKHYKNIINHNWKYTGIYQYKDKESKNWYCQVFAH